MENEAMDVPMEPIEALTGFLNLLSLGSIRLDFLRYDLQEMVKRKIGIFRTMNEETKEQKNESSQFIGKS
jgi:hypothetical protein